MTAMTKRALLAALGATASAVAVSRAQGQAAAPVKIGVLDDMSGVYSAMNGPGGIVGARLALEDFGRSVLGRPIQIVSADDQNKPDIGLALARRWIDTEGVSMITGLGNSAVALGVQALAREKGIIDIVSGAVSYDLTGKSCSPTGFHWTHDTRAYASTVPQALIDAGSKTFFFITVDYTFGHSLEAESTAQIVKSGGKVLGSVRHPLGTADFSSYLLQAQGSKAEVIILVSGGQDVINAIKASQEFGIQAAGQKMAVPILYVSDIDSLGLKTTQGLITATPYFPGFDAATRAFAERFMARHNGVAPSPSQAGTYGGVLHYLKAVAAAGTLDGKTVAAKMRELPVNDMMSHDVRIRNDGRVMRDFYVVKVKEPSEKQFPYDYFTLLKTLHGDEVFRSLAEGGCQLV